MKHNYIKCLSCDNRFNLNKDPLYWKENPCEFCKNTRQVIDPKEILCNLCGECMCPLGTMNEQYPHGLHEAKVDGGYDSHHLFDLTSYTFSFCEKCLRALFNQCKIKPVIFDSIDHTNKTWEEDQKQYEYRIWKDEGGHHQAYLNKKCNFEKDCPNEAVYTQLVSDEFTEDCCCEVHKSKFNYGNVKFTKFIPNVLKAFL
jgi:hypothetical protein